MAARYNESLGQLPAGIVQHVRALANGEISPAEPRHASTVVLLRDGADGVEAYLLRRQQTMAFAAGMYVFPGGSTDPRDEALPDQSWHGPAPTAWASLLTADEQLAKALVCAAVRETFEESGVLLAASTVGDIVADTTADDWELDRQALLSRELSLAEMLGRRSLVLRADLLRAWAHWITPEVEPRRYDTRFFVAALPTGQRTRDVGGESDRTVWMRPVDALSALDRGELAMMPPTAFTLNELTAYETVGAVLEAGSARDVRPVLPRIVLTDDDEAELLLPHHEGYDG